MQRYFKNLTWDLIEEFWDILLLLLTFDYYPIEATSKTHEKINTNKIHILKSFFTNIYTSS